MRRLRPMLVLLALLVAAGGFVFYRAFAPYRGFEGPQTFVDIPRGTSTEGIAALLAEAGVVRSRWDFLAARAIAHGRVLQAGEYRFARPASPVEVYDRIARGDVFYYELVVPEGRNMFEIGAAVEQLGLFSAARFLAAARNPALIRDLDPVAPNLEGYLFPSTYRLSRHTTPEGLCRIMTGKFREVWKGLNAGANVHHTITLASLIEREAKLPGERPEVAAVFVNRLERGMKLDCDPTTVYAALLAGRYRGAIYRSDLDSDDAYNTYRHAGLPPGPIANPGTASIEAALHPADSEVLYFVLRPDGSGGHQFSTTLAAHEAAVARYRHGAQ
ncbi:MAG TPA: endolytic transglycosylase MltG [Bryobacteraceae bacterium]|nr:endolytic transglycosylase MltG [Bryobacteraceae bacterium]